MNNTTAAIETAKLLVKEMGQPHLIQYFGERLNAGLDLPTRPQLIRAYTQLAGSDAKELLKQIVVDNKELPTSRSTAIKMLAQLESANSASSDKDFVKTITLYLDSSFGLIVSAAASALVKLGVDTVINRLRSLLEQGVLDPNTEHEVRVFVENAQATSVDQIIPPIPTESFVMRDAELQGVRQAFESEKGSIMVSLCGMAGMGKTFLAAWYARQAPFDLVFWVVARDQTDAASFLGTLTHQIELQRPGTMSSNFYKSLDESFNQESVIRQTRLSLEKETSLLVVDDLDASLHPEELRELIQSLIDSFPKMRCLITSRHHPSNWKHMHFVELSDLSKTDVTQFVHQTMEEQGIPISPDLTEKIIKMSGGIPFVIRLALENWVVHGRLPQFQEQQDFLKNALEHNVQGLNLQQRRFLEILAYFDEGIDLSNSIINELLGREDAELNNNEIQVLFKSVLIKRLSDGRIDITHIIIREYFQQMADQRTRIRVNQSAGEYYLAQSDILRAARHFALGQNYRRAVDEISMSLRSLINQGHAQEVLRLLSEDFKHDNYERGIDLQRLGIIGNIRYQLGYFFEAEEIYQQMLSITIDSDDLKNESDIFNSLGDVYQAKGMLDKALSLYEESLALKEQIGDIQGKAASLHQMAQIYLMHGDVDKALSLYEESLALKEQVNDIQGKAASIHQMAQVYLMRGDVDKALSLYEESLALKEQIGDIPGKAASLHQMAQIYVMRGELDKALSLYEESLAMHEQIGDIHGKAASLSNMAQVYLTHEELDKALSLYEESLAMHEQIGNIHGKAILLHQMAQVYLTRGDVDKALLLYEESLALKEQIGDIQGKAASLHQMAQVYLTRSDLDKALSLYEESLALKMQTGDIQGKAVSLSSMASLWMAREDWDQAEKLLQEALAISQQLGELQGIAFNVAKLGQVAQTKDDLELARQRFTESHAIFQKLGMPRETAQVKDLLDRLTVM